MKHAEFGDKILIENRGNPRQVLTKCSKIKHVYEVLCVLNECGYRDFRVGVFYFDSASL